MANFCLIPAGVDRFKQALVKGDITPEKLSAMTSEERHAALAKIVGEPAAKGVNSLFESKLLLKNQQQGMVSWAKSVAGLKPEVRRDLISRIEKLDRVLNPADHEQFLKDLASTRLGVDVTQAEAKTIADMSKKIQDTKAAMDSGGDRMDYGRAKVDLGKYVSDLKHEASKLSPLDLVKSPGKLITEAASLSKSLKASLDDSAIFRQGWKSMFTNPIEWQANARKSFTDFAKTIKGEDVLHEVTADIVSRPNYDRYQKAGLATATIEEAFPSQLPEKIPGVGRAFKASEAAYTGFLHRQRADIFDKLLVTAEKNGVNIDDKAQLQSMGKLVNALTGRGHLGGLERSANTVNSVFFSPRSLKANIDTLTAHQFQKDVTPFVRKQAAQNLVKIVGGTAAVLAVANAVKPGSVEFDPRSADFGKIRVGNTRFDVSGGMAGILTLAARLASQSTKSSSTGEVNPLGGSAPGSKSGADVLVSFLENKLSPSSSVIKDLISQKDFNGNKPTVLGELTNAFVPLPITTYQELRKDPNAANPLIGLIADGLGIATNTYGQTTTDWAKNPSQTLQQFQQKVGDAKFKQANDDYNKKLDEWQKNNKTYLRDLPNDKKQPALDTVKQHIQDSVFKDNGFKYKAAPKPKTGYPSSKNSSLSDALSRVKPAHKARR